MRIEDLKDYTPSVIGYRKRRMAAVLIPLIQRDGEYHILFQVRSRELKRQPGDVCFPGGGRQGDETPEENAIRETCEELLVKREQIRMIGPSDFFSENGITVYPFVAELLDYRGTFSVDEVSEVFSVPLKFFLETEPACYEVQARMEFPEDFPFEKIQRGKDYKWNSRREPMLFWEYEDHVIWGMSARILLGLVQILRVDRGQAPL